MQKQLSEINLTDVAEQKKPVYTTNSFGEKKIGFTEFRLQFQSFLPKKTRQVYRNKTSKENTSQKGILIRWEL